ncbi:PREDICTED: exocyst complex component 4-like [Priapulus caudatus]|uniref:Exocyst complex component Sec8 n=1 Tax=Priapulus caudatus TaxID=37621 RepID=A0ABM1EJ75_PRICU|nr:PREDICTED: exocyst complex component 4-like [Priapulus caudatus]
MENVVAPPRRKKTTPQDSVGLLMSLVRSLSQSENMKEREDIKRELERNFKECDQNMDKLIQTHHEDLTSLIQAFSKIYTRITVSREKIKNIKEMLHSCKSLLHCKRDELKKLYIEGVEQKQVLVLLEQIDQVKEVPQRLHAYMSKKHYLHASEELVSALARLEEDLSEVDGLHDLRLELQDKKAAHVRWRFRRRRPLPTATPAPSAKIYTR